MEEIIKSQHNDYFYKRYEALLSIKKAQSLLDIALSDDTNSPQTDSLISCTQDYLKFVADLLENG
jgi:hypothetical protein